MSGLRLGNEPIPLVVHLAGDADFVAALVADPGPWPAGTVLTLLVGVGDAAVEWPATITGERADWRIPAEQVRTVLGQALSAARSARLRYTGGTDAPTLIWARGRVQHG